VRLCSFINMSQYVSTSKESALVACVTQEIYPEQSARHAARGTCVCVRECVCVCVTMCTQRVEQERSKRMIKIDRVCVCVCVYVLYGATHATRTRIFQTRFSPNVKVSTRKCGCVNLLCMHLCDASLFRSGNR